MRRCSSLIRRLLPIMLAAAVFAGPGVFPVMACPNCKAANEEDNVRPRAYMYSILFMLGVPGTMATGVAVGLVVLSRRENATLEQGGLADDPPVT